MGIYTRWERLVRVNVDLSWMCIDLDIFFHKEDLKKSKVVYNLSKNVVGWVGVFVNELRNSKRFIINENSPYQLTVKIEDYRPSYHKYVALSATILDTTTNQTIWNASISGLSKKTIDEVTQNVIQELVKEMLGKDKWLGMGSHCKTWEIFNDI